MNIKMIFTFIISFILFFASTTLPISNPNGNQSPENNENIIVEGNESNSDENLNDCEQNETNDRDENPENNESVVEDDEHIKKPFFMRAAWIPTVYQLNYPTKSTTNSQLLKDDIDKIVLQSVSLGLNTLFFQVRPCADSLYNSKIFPWSKYLTGNQGIKPNNGFDPLSYIIQECHKNNIELHAWINPFRIIASVNDTIISSHPATLNPELTFSVNSKLYFNPGVPEARKLIINGVKEIIDNYDVDGIHYDDYFYPEGDLPDLDTFFIYGDGFNNIDDWRRNNIDELIKETHNVIKENSSNLIFGVSPSGIWANLAGNALGSDTKGFESYYKIYADSRGWVKRGFVDYIAPQIYWYIGQNGSDFLTLLRWWYDVCKDTGVKLYVGLAGYKSSDVNQHALWNNGEELKKQVAYSLDYSNGIIIYSFKDAQKPEAIKALEFSAMAEESFK